MCTAAAVVLEPACLDCRHCKHAVGWGIGLVVKHFHSKYKALGSIPSTRKWRKRGRYREKDGGDKEEREGGKLSGGTCQWSQCLRGRRRVIRILRQSLLCSKYEESLDYLHDTISKMMGEWGTQHSTMNFILILGIDTSTRWLRVLEHSHKC